MSLSSLARDARSIVLIVDDQPHNLDIVVNYLADKGLELVVATDGEQALALAAECHPELVLLDMMMPGINGIGVCRRLKQNPATAGIPVIFMSALTDTASKVEGFAAGAIDYVDKPLQREEVLARIQAHLTIRRQQQQLQLKNEQLEALNRDLQEQVQRRRQAEEALNLAGETLSALTQQEAEHWGIDAFVGQSRATRELLDEVRSLQSAPHTNVIVLGESGVGKELISRAIHFGSERRKKPFVAVNCSAIPAELADAEFFGHVKGAFTGATGDRHGYFLQADGGTLFLDEIGDMPPPLQVKLLRVLEDGLVTPVGGRDARRVDVRVVAATNVDLLARVRDREFRQDLYFRLAGYQLVVPPLRNRLSDIPLLVDHFVSRLSRQMGRDRPTVGGDAIAALSRYQFPGNVRELKNLIEYALIASRGRAIGAVHLRFFTVESPETIPQNPWVNPTNAAPSNAVPAASADTASAENTFVDPERELLDYVRASGRIDNTQAQQLLAVSHGRASYLLKKLHRDGLLQRQGERRWSYYTLR